jgi:hypothetical protein
MDAAATPPPEYAGLDGKKRPWAGLVRNAPHGACIAGKCRHVQYSIKYIDHYGII